MGKNSNVINYHNLYKKKVVVTEYIVRQRRVGAFAKNKRKIWELLAYTIMWNSNSKTHNSFCHY